MTRLAACLLALVLTGCGGGSEADPPPLSAAAKLGQRAFHDPSLSASGRQSCASCHAPQAGHGSANAFPVQFGGPERTVAGLRNTQSLRYLAGNTPFHFDAQGRPRGGFLWDGRVDSLEQQAAIPLLSASEMANPDQAAVAAKIAAAEWAGEFRAVYGTGILNDADAAFTRLTEALAAFQREDAAFNGYTSKYDAVQRGETMFSIAEARGLAKFTSQCAACHPAPLFTDFGYSNLGLPRNMEIPANADAAYHDLGLCNRPELQQRGDLCGAFKVPSLRNVASRQALFHNGLVTSLREGVALHVRRDMAPDLPVQYLANVDSTPFQLTDSEIEDVVAFLRTLTDGYVVPAQAGTQGVENGSSGFPPSRE